MTHHEHPYHVRDHVRRTRMGSLGYDYPLHWSFRTFKGRVIGICVKTHNGPHPTNRLGMTVAKTETLFERLLEWDDHRGPQGNDAID